jgi:hypothetical protein
MPKRIIDGDALWASEKLLLVDEKYRCEYAWILPMANANGCFECSPMLVWRTCYAGLRPSWKIEDVATMLDTFESTKMLYRFKVAGKTYGFFVGSQKEGRLPKPSDRVKSAKLWQSGMLPADELAAFLEMPVEMVKAEFRYELATSSPGTRPELATTSPIGNGIGVGIGLGNGNGIGNGITLHNGNTEYITAHHSAEEVKKPKSINSLSSSETAGTLDSPATDLNWAEDMAEEWYRLMESNQFSSQDEIPKNWKILWAGDFRKLAERYPLPLIRKMVEYSQTESQRKYYIRTITLLKRADALIVAVTGKSQSKESPAKAKVKKPRFVEDEPQASDPILCQSCLLPIIDSSCPCGLAETPAEAAAKIQRMNRFEEIEFLDKATKPETCNFDDDEIA